MQTSVADVKKIQEIVADLLGKLGVSARAKVFAVEEYIKIEIEGKDSPILIGFHGETLRSLKHIISIMIKKQISEDAVVLVDVANYLERREEQIKDMARKAISKFQKTKRPVDMPAMNAYERRIAHSYISEAGFSSESAGQGFDRHIVVKK